MIVDIPQSPFVPALHTTVMRFAVWRPTVNRLGAGTPRGLAFFPVSHSWAWFGGTLSGEPGKQGLQTLNP